MEFFKRLHHAGFIRRMHIQPEPLLEAISLQSRDFYSSLVVTFS